MLPLSFNNSNSDMPFNVYLKIEFKKTVFIKYSFLYFYIKHNSKNTVFIKLKESFIALYSLQNLVTHLTLLTLGLQSFH